jgi:uncharacterized tellurite resistance protein B-like protein
LWESIKARKKSYESLELNEQTAVLIILHFTISADGTENFEEVELLQQIVSKSPLFEENSYKQDKQLIAQVKNYCGTQGISILDKAINILPPHLQKAVVYMAIEMVFVDGKVTEKEKAFIEMLSSKVDLELEKVKSAIEIFSAIYIH